VAFREWCGLATFVITAARLFVSVAGSVVAFRLAKAWRGDLRRLHESGENGDQAMILKTQIVANRAAGWLLAGFTLMAVLTLSRGYRFFAYRGIMDVIIGLVMFAMNAGIAYAEYRKRRERSRLGELARQATA
jgi:hypothetical protein